MTSERWDRVKDLLHRAMQLAPGERARFLDQSCSSDRSLRAEVESLLSAGDEVRSGFLESAPQGFPDDTRVFRAMPELSPQLPRRFGPYEILGPIAKGGMGEVYRARDTRLGRSVAVKILPAEMCRDSIRLARFEKEARTAGALNHPNIVCVYDIGRENGIPFIVTELIEGESLRSLIARGPVPAQQLLDIATQLAAGLRAAHAAGVVHRDLKPENIMLTPDAQVKILDFGLAKHTPESLDGQSTGQTQPLTAPGVVLGTLAYLSPEQVRGETVDARSDIFSLGGVLYELASGWRPFSEGKPIDILSAILREEPPPLRAAIPPALDRIIQRCLQKDPQRRFPDAGALAVALKSVGEISRTRHRRIWWTAAAAIILAIFACIAWLVPRYQPKSSPPPTNSPPYAGPGSLPRQQAAVDETKIHGEGNGIGMPAPKPQPITRPVAAVPEPPAPARTPVIEVLAGRPWKFTGDGMPAKEVALGHVDDVKCDREGNLYATDWGNQVIVKIDRGDILHVLAGPDSPPDDRPRSPHYLVVDGSNLYFSQIFAIRKLSLPSGHVANYAGKFTAGSTPDGSLALGSAISEVTGLALAADGSVIFSESSNPRVRRVDAKGNLQTLAGTGVAGFSGDGGLALRATLAFPRGLARDRAGNLYIADAVNHCVRRVSPYGWIATVAGHGVAGSLGCPTALALNQHDELFISDPCLGQVLSLRGGRLSVFAGTGVLHDEPSGDGGPATAASFDLWSLAFDAQDNLFVAGPDFGHIYRISRDRTFSIVAGSGLWGATRDGTPANQAEFQSPFRVTVGPDGSVFMTDLGANRIYRLDKGIVTLVAGYPGFSHPSYEGEDKPARYYRLNAPHGIRVRPDGRVVFADRDNNRVREVTSGRLRTIAGNLNHPSGICLDHTGNVYIADTGNHQIKKLTLDGKLATIAGDLNSPTAVEVDSSGDLYIADAGNHRIERVSGGAITTLAEDVDASDLALGPDRQLYALDSTNRRIQKIDVATAAITTYVSTPGRPGGIAADAAGNIYVTDMEARQIRIIRPPR